MEGGERRLKFIIMGDGRVVEAVAGAEIDPASHQW